MPARARVRGHAVARPRTPGGPQRGKRKGVARCAARAREVVMPRRAGRAAWWAGVAGTGGRACMTAGVRGRDGARVRGGAIGNGAAGGASVKLRRDGSEGCERGCIQCVCVLRADGTRHADGAR
eukprot:2011446-Prymnesium_polylepis.1